MGLRLPLLAGCAVFSAVAIGVAAQAEESLALPGPAPRPRAAEVSGLGRSGGDASCAACHPAEAAEWRSSLHKRAWADPVFKKAYAVEPMAFCRGCHAPEADPASEPDQAARDVGVSCRTCHVEGGHVVGPRPSAGAMHDLTADARMATAAACASCHQFDFPIEAHEEAPQPMQDTVAEHARSAARETPCQSCHMPEVDGPDGRHRSHAFAVLTDPKLIRSAAKVTAERLDGARVRVTLAPANAGHSFPTGDLFRRLEVRAETVGRRHAAAEPVVLARRFADRAREENGRLTSQRVEVGDDRVPPPGGRPVQVVLELPRPAPGAAVKWQVVYQRMSTPMASALGVSQVLDEIVVAEGELAPLAVATNLSRAEPGERK